jgi:hypothetical protein
MRVIRGAAWSGAATAVLAAFALGSCGDDGGNGGGGGGETEVLQDRLGSALDYSPGFTDAIDRLITTINGSPQPGVDITPNLSGYSGTVDVDLDGDGTYDTSVSGALVLTNPSAGLVGGATLVVDDVEGLTTAQGSASVGVTGPASAFIAGGNFTGTRTGTNPELDLSISSANIGLDVSSGNLVVSGTTGFFYNGISGDMEFVPVAGGFEIDVSGDGFDPFTVP